MTTMNEQQGSCADCAYWAAYASHPGIPRGECMASSGEVPESLLSIQIRRREGLIFHPVDDKDYAGILVTPADFSCSCWQLHPEAGEQK